MFGCRYLSLYQFEHIELNSRYHINYQLSIVRFKLIIYFDKFMYLDIKSANLCNKPMYVYCIVLNTIYDFLRF